MALGLWVLVVSSFSWVAYDPAPISSDRDIKNADQNLHIVSFIYLGLGLTGMAVGRSDPSSLIYTFMIIGISCLNFFCFDFVADLVPLGLAAPNAQPVITLSSLNNALGMSSATIVAFYPVLQRVPMLLLLALMLVFQVTYSGLNLALKRTQHYDPAALCLVHIYGGLFGTFLTSRLHEALSKAPGHEEEHSGFLQVMTTLGSVFCWVMLPLIVANGAEKSSRVAFSMVLGMAASTSACLMTSEYFRTEAEQKDAFASAMAGAFAVSGVVGLKLNPAVYLSVGSVVGVLVSILVNHDRVMAWFSVIQHEPDGDQPRKLAFYDPSLNLAIHVVPSCLAMLVQFGFGLTYAILENGSLLADFPAGDRQWVRSISSPFITIAAALLAIAFSTLFILLQEKNPEFFSDDAVQLYVSN